MNNYLSRGRDGGAARSVLHQGVQVDQAEGVGELAEVEAELHEDEAGQGEGRRPERGGTRRGEQR